MRKIELTTFKNMKLPEPGRFIVEGVIFPESKALIFGESNVGKSLVAQRLAVCVAAGLKWNGKNVQSGPVLYIGAEDGGSLPARLTALKNKYEISEDIPLAFHANTIDLLKPNADLEPLINAALHFSQQVQKPISMIFIDTFAAVFNGGDENTAKDMGAFLQNIERLRAKTNSTIVVIHHAGKATEKGARGHSSFRAAVDTEILVTDNAIKVTKQRNGPKGSKFGFKIEQVPINKDSQGQDVFSAVAVETSVLPSEPKPKLNNAALQSLEVLRSLTLSPQAPVSVEAWRKRFLELHAQHIESRSGRWKHFGNTLETLSALRYIETRDGIAYIR